VNVIWTPEAQLDRADIWEHIATDNPHAAAKMDELFSDAASHLRHGHANAEFIHIVLPCYVLNAIRRAADRTAAKGAKPRRNRARQCVGKHLHRFPPRRLDALGTRSLCFLAHIL
jgi:hypothetical protein